jgi:hypothetical protein
MYKANIYLKYYQRKHAYAAPCPPEGGLTHGLPISNLVLICALAPLQGIQGLSESIVKSDSF